MASEKRPTLVVQKYGGATLATPEKVKAAASRLTQLHTEGVKVVAVVSAMGSTTNQLIELAQQVSKRPNRREMDMLLTTGERISMALVSMALQDLGCKAISFTGSQAGILTNESHVNACITDVKAFRVEEALLAGKVVVLAGFQGVSPVTKEITTLGRGGSDTTAVAMAAYLKADLCEILKDVEAVFSADPGLVPTAKVLHQLTYDQLLEMSFWGAKVLHYRSVELAKEKKVPLYIGPASRRTSEGTYIPPQNQEKSSMYETHKILAINSHEHVLELKTIETSSHEALQKMQACFEENEIAFPQILQVFRHEKHWHFILTGPQETLSAISSLDKKHFSLSESALSTVTATCTGSTSSEMAKLILEKLENKKIAPLALFQSAMSTTVLLPRQHRESAVKELHQLI